MGTVVKRPRRAFASTGARSGGSVSGHLQPQPQPPFFVPVFFAMVIPFSGLTAAETDLDETAPTRSCTQVHLQE